MPEGPEIRLEADRIERVLIGEPLRSVTFGLPRLEHHAESLTGSRVYSVQTLGKAMLTHFDNGQSMYSHNQLYGQWRVCKRGKEPQTNRSLRVGLHTDSHSALLYSASDIDILSTDCVAEHPFTRKLGLDVLDQSLSWRAVAQRLVDDRFCRRAVSSLYLDQGFLAGVGNYLRSEILFLAGVHPSAKPTQLGQGDIGHLARSTLLLSQRAYETRGLTNPPRRVQRLKAEGLGYEAYRFAVFGRDGSPCFVCGGPVERGNFNSRRLYHCPSCQPMPQSAR